MERIIRIGRNELCGIISEAIGRVMAMEAVTVRDLAYSPKKFVGTFYDDFERRLRRSRLGFELADSYFTGDGKVIATLKNDNDDCIYVEVEWDGYHAGKILYIETLFGRRSRAEYDLHEGWKRNVAAGMLGLATLFPGQMNAQTRGTDYQQQNSTYSIAQDYGSLGDYLRSKGMSKKKVRSLGRQFNPTNVMMRNAKGQDNAQIRQFLSTLNQPSSSMSTKNVKVFGYSEHDAQSRYLSKFNEKNAAKYKLFTIEDGTVMMPANYTIQDVQRELQPHNTFQMNGFNG